MTTRMHRCVALQCCCAWLSLPPSCQLTPPPFSDLLDDLMQEQMDRTGRPCSLLGVGATSQSRCKVPLNLITALITGSVVSSQAADSLIKLQTAAHMLLFDELNSSWWRRTIVFVMHLLSLRCCRCFSAPFREMPFKCDGVGSTETPQLGSTEKGSLKTAEPHHFMVKKKIL